MAGPYRPFFYVPWFFKPRFTVWVKLCIANNTSILKQPNLLTNNPINLLLPCKYNIGSSLLQRHFFFCRVKNKCKASLLKCESGFIYRQQHNFFLP